MILTTTDTINGKNIEHLGLVRGGTVQTRNVARDITQQLKSLVGGELHAYTELLSTARALATKRMVEDAQAMGADAIVCIRYDGCSIMQGATEIIAYGTAVRFVP